jgi:hypothetical protein
MTMPAREPPRGRPKLTVVRGTPGPVPRNDMSDWRRIAAAVLACTHELTLHLAQRRWGRVEEAMNERRELLTWFSRLPLDGEGRRSLRALAQAAAESDSAILAMARPMGMGGRPARR